MPPKRHALQIAAAAPAAFGISAFWDGPVSKKKGGAPGGAKEGHIEGTKTWS